MPDSSFDDIFKDRLHPHESLVPEDMWERITKKKDRDRGFLFFFRLSGLFLLGFAVAFYLLTRMDRSAVTNDLSKDSLASSHSASPAEEVRPADSNLKSLSPVEKTTTTLSADPKLKINDGRINHKTKGNFTDATVKKNKSGKPGAVHPDKNSGGGTKEHGASIEKDQDDLIADSTLTSNTSSANSNSALKTVTTNPSAEKKPVLADSMKNSVPHNTKPQAETIKAKWSLDLYVSPDYPLDYADSWFKSKLSFTVGLRINRSFGEHFSAKAGIQFSQINYSAGDSAGIANPYHIMRFDLPVLAGYSWGNEKLGFSVNTGFIANIYTWIEPGYSGFIKTNTGVSLYLGFNIKTRANDRLDIFTEPYYRYQLSSMTVSNIQELKFIDVAGLSFGVRYYLKKRQ